jgi:hypothetical protein
MHLPTEDEFMRRAIHGAPISAIRYGFDITAAARLDFDDRESFRQFTLPSAKRSIPETQLARDEAPALAEKSLAMPGRRIYIYPGIRSRHCGISDQRFLQKATKGTKDVPTPPSQPGGQRSMLEMPSRTRSPSVVFVPVCKKI